MSLVEKFFAMVLALVGPAPADSPKELQLKPRDTIVAIGDSITAAGGYLRDIDAVLAQQYPDLKLSKVINKGISGQKAEDLVARFDRDVIALRPAYVTLSIGINDVWHRLSKPHDEKILAAYKRECRQDGRPSSGGRHQSRFCSRRPSSEKTPTPKATGGWRNTLEAEKQIAAEKKCQLVDLHGMFLTAIKQKPAGQATWLTSDSVHMKPLGDALMAIGVLRASACPTPKSPPVIRRNKSAGIRHLEFDIHHAPMYRRHP